MPEGWEEEPAKNAQKDKDARWTKKNDESFYGNKNHNALEGARRCRARIRSPAELDGRQDRAHHRHCAGESQDWDGTSVITSASARTGGGCARLSALTGGVRVALVQNDRTVAHQASKRSRSGAHSGTSAAIARSPEAEIAEIKYCSRCPKGKS
jgi:hypothetical protein